MLKYIYHYIFKVCQQARLSPVANNDFWLHV